MISKYMGAVLGVCTILPALWLAYDIGADSSDNKDQKKMNGNVELAEIAEFKNRLNQLEIENRSLSSDLAHSQAATKELQIALLESQSFKPSDQAVVKITQNRNLETVNKVPFINGQKWKGYYSCNQSKTSLTLRIKSVESQGVQSELGLSYGVDAIFDFDYKNRTATGAFYVHGSYYPESNVMIFDPGEWIRNSAGYSSVGMDGKVSNGGASFTGKILYRGCDNFRLTLQ